MTRNDVLVSRSKGTEMTGRSSRAEPPPSTIAAQLVDNLSATGSHTQPGEQENFDQLLREILSSENAFTAENVSVELDIKFSFKLICVVTRAGLDVLLQHDPFRDVTHLLPRANDSLAVISSVIRRNPEVIFYKDDNREGSIISVELYVSLLPKIWNLLGQPRAATLLDRLKDLLSVILSSSSGRVKLWPSFIKVLRSYCVCVQGLLCCNDDWNRLADTRSSISLVEYLSKVVSDECLSQNHKNQISNPAQATVIAFYMLETLFSFSDARTRHEIDALVAGDNVLWTLDCLGKILRGLQWWSEEPSIGERQTEIHVSFLKLIHQIQASDTAMIPLSLRPDKATLLVADAVGYILGIPSLALDSQLQRLLCLSLIDILDYSRKQSAIRPCVEERLRCPIGKLYKPDSHVKDLTKPLQFIIKLWLHHNQRQPGLFLDDEVQLKQEALASEFADEELHSKFSVLELSNGNGLEIQESRPSKRARHDVDFTSRDDINFMPTLVDKLFSLLGGQTATDLDGLDQIAIGCYAKLSEEDKTRALSYMGYVTCAGAGTLKGLGEKKGDLSNGRCSFCDDQPNSKLPRKLWQDSHCDMLLSIVSTIMQTPGFLQSPRERVAAMLSLRRLLSHTPSSSLLDLRQSDFGQWCLKSHFSSLRELRIAAGRLLSVFLRDGIEEGLLRKNRLAALELLRAIKEKGELTFHESCVLTCGQIAAAAGDEELNLVLLQLVEYLGHTNLLIHGSAYNQILRLSQLFGLTPRAFFRPFWRSVAIAAVKDLQNRPQIAQLLSDLFTIKVSDLLIQTQIYTLPYLVLHQRSDLIQRIAQARGVSVRVLCLDKSNLAAILALLLVHPSTDVEKTTMALLYRASPDLQGADFMDIVASDPITLTYELLRAAGEGDDTVRPKIHQAIQLVAKLVHSKPSQTSQGKRTNFLGPFFETYVLGIMSLFSEIINDAKERQPSLEKRRCLKAIEEMIRISKSHCANALPQICACLQSALDVDDLRDQAFSTWATMVMILDEQEIKSLLDPTFSVILQYWNLLNPPMRQRAYEVVESLLDHHNSLIERFGETLPALSSIHELAEFDTQLERIKSTMDLGERFQAFSERCQSENLAVVSQALVELVSFLRKNATFLHETAVSEQPDPVVAKLMRSILNACVRFNKVLPSLAGTCAECIGLIGCLDSNRVEAPLEKRDILVLSNFEAADETVEFVLFFLEEILVKAFLSATNTQAQGFLAYAMQELLHFCGLHSTVTFRSHDTQSHSNWRRWTSLPQSVQDTLTPFLTSRYVLTPAPANPERRYPIYTRKHSHGAWLREFVLDLLHKSNGENARKMFSVCSRIIRAQDLSIANFLLPFAALNVVISGTERQIKDISSEFHVVLGYSLPKGATTRSEEEHLKYCSESVFRVLDYFSRWVQEKKKQISNSKYTLMRTGRQSDFEDEVGMAQVRSVERILSEVPVEIVSRRAIDCRSFTRALFYWEQYIRQEREKLGTNSEERRLEPLFEKLQDIYTQIDEPDGIEGISAHLPVLDVDQQILEHRKAGRWTAAQSWYEALLSEQPNNIEVQLGLLSCLKESGRHDFLLKHVEGSNIPSSANPRILPFAVEASWVTGRWDLLGKYLSSESQISRQTFNTGVGRALLALRRQDMEDFTATIKEFREELSHELSEATISSFQSCHDIMLKCHVLTELEAISGVSTHGEKNTKVLMENLNHRLDVLGAFSLDKQYLLGIRRATMELSMLKFSNLDLASQWLESAKLARKGNFTHQAFNAVLRASQLGDSSATIEHCRLLWKEGHRRKAIQNLEGAIAANAFTPKGKSLVEHPNNAYSGERGRHQNLLSARAYLLLAKWHDTAGQTPSPELAKKYWKAADAYPRWEKVHYQLGKHYNKLLESEAALPISKQGVSYLSGETAKLVVENFLRSLQFGAKYIFQTMPKLLTLWLDTGSRVDEPISLDIDEKFDRQMQKHRREILKQLNLQVEKFVGRLPAYEFYTALSQLVSRICHPHSEVYGILVNIIVKVVIAHPQQALWTVLAVVKSSSRERASRGLVCINRIKEYPKKKVDPAAIDPRKLVNQGQKLSEQLLNVCEAAVEAKVPNVSLSRDLGFSHKVVPCQLVMPIESALSASLPTMTENANIKSHRAFSRDTVTVHAFLDDVLILNSLQRPRKLSVKGSDGRVYGLLCKPKDDLRKDQRLMEFDSMINRALKKDAEASKRRLYIKTYAVTPLNEECGLIQWIDNLKAFRDIILKIYRQKNVVVNYVELRKLLDDACSDVSIFTDKILPSFPSVFHEWFVGMFPETDAWFAARLRYTRSCAVMSIVGYVLGLGDRHGENILFEGNGGTFHVDFNCLFDKGLTFEKPELVPFRLTHNMIDAFGAYGYEGPFRKSCELTMGVLRQHQDTLMTILETFLHDPTTDFIGKKKRSNIKVPETPQEVLDSVRSKVRGLFMDQTVPLSIEGHVDALIQQATDPSKLAAMYIGWIPFF
ncbi:hypothetical protein L228DRAFT_247070 [Xylona heveae TC161]|uniref:non-specific serine/threonine protein kinase n=1 Tax=Xylona heveae (strain CBS 132557 / TC161) TaxID=1328760 RepID=A0A165GWT1_XYLHT|nr:hypothetical protein L228DRAFT_247070 [Xylona heveae TC161]KZF22699.1 hypothetical protein L228DRAFT_247070 [Xylona heveae TC161]